MKCESVKLAVETSSERTKEQMSKSNLEASMSSLPKTVTAENLAGAGASTEDIKHD